MGKTLLLGFFFSSSLLYVWELHDLQICIDNRIEWKCFSISFRCFPFSFSSFIFSSFTFLSFTSLFFSSLFFIPKSNQNTYICSQSGCWHWSDGSIEIDTQYVRISCLPYRMYISYKKRSKSSGVVIVKAMGKREGEGVWRAKITRKIIFHCACWKRFTCRYNL